MKKYWKSAMCVLLCLGLCVCGGCGKKGAEVTDKPQPSADAQPSAEPQPSADAQPADSEDLTFDPEGILGQDISVISDKFGEPTSKYSDTNWRWDSGDGKYDFSIELDGSKIRSVAIFSGPTILGIDFGVSEDDVKAALEGLGTGVNSRDAGGGQTSYSATSADGSLLYDVGCQSGMAINRSVHLMTGY